MYECECMRVCVVVRVHACVSVSVTACCRYCRASIGCHHRHSIASRYLRRAIVESLLAFPEAVQGWSSEVPVPSHLVGSTN